MMNFRLYFFLRSKLISVTEYFIHPFIELEQAFLEYAKTFFQSKALFVEEEYPALVEKFNLIVKSTFLNRDWLYSFSENMYAYTYDINMYIYPALEMFFSNENFRIVFENPTNNIYIQLFDTMYPLFVIMLPYLSKFFHRIVDDWDFINIINIHPEYFFIFKSYYFRYFHHFFGNLYASVFILNITESFITPPMMLMQFIGIFFAVLIFIVMFFNYYSRYTTEDTIIDHDFLSFNVTIEAEEEIGSMDDMLMASVILVYVFFWFFWIYSWSALSIIPALTMTIVLFPLLYFIILFIPFSLLYDYGSYFLTYLNGVSKSSVMSIEFLFDIIAVSIFFLRLTVQNVRLVFMLFTYTELHEMIVFYFNDKNVFIFNEFFNEAWEKVKTVVKNSNYSFIISIPLNILRWLYELFHTFFMLIFQFIAFFAMIFWLFLFLYSMFVSETQEAYFEFKRKLHKTLSKKLLILKNK